MSMMIGLGLTNPAALRKAAVVQPVQAVNADGWSVTYPAPPATLNPIAAAQTLSVQRAGFNAAGQAVTVPDRVTLMARVRQSYPAQAGLTADRVALSDFIYAGDVVPGVTNGSNLAYPQPIACWLTPDLERARGATFSAQLSVAHAYARAGRPVAAVKFIASDGVNTVTQMVSAMTSRQFASGLHAPYFEANIDLGSLAAGSICTLDAVIYPWVGSAFQLSVDAGAYPTINLSVLKFLNDRAGSYGDAFAYVDATAGNNATAVVSATGATAAAAPYATIAAAAAAIKTFNAAHYGHSDTSGGTIRLVAGVHAHANFSAATSGAIPLVIEAADVTAKASTVYTDNGANVSAGFPGKVKLKDLTLRKVGGSVIFLDNGATIATLDRMMVLQNVTVDRNGTSTFGAWIYRTGRMYLVEVDGAADGLFSVYNGNACKEINAVGCSGAWGSMLIFNAVGCKIYSMQRVPGFANVEVGVGQLVHHCLLTETTDGHQAFLASGLEIGARGLGLVGCVLEQTGGTTGAVLRMQADSDVFATQNVLYIGVTAVGSRSNWLYQDTGSTTIAKRGFRRFSVDMQHNTKTDVFGANGNLVGNWPAAYNVGNQSNASVQGSSDGGVAVPGVGVWLGEVAGLGDAYGSAVAPLVTAWANDQSFAGGRAGGGDYTPGVGNTLPHVPAGMAPYPMDMMGRVVRNDGGAVAGAVQPA